MDKVGDVHVEALRRPRARRGSGEERFCEVISFSIASLFVLETDACHSAFARIENHYFVNDVGLVPSFGIIECLTYMAHVGIHEGRPAARKAGDRQNVGLEKPN